MRRELMRTSSGQRVPRNSVRPTGGPWGRARWIAAWLVGSAVVAGLAFGAGTFVRSPWDSAVKNSREQLEATVAVAERDFVAEIPTADGAVALGRDLDIGPPTGCGTCVVTGAYVTVGQRIPYGSPLVAVSGRPLFALDLEIPLYRDLERGMNGPDVESLQRSFQQVGLYRGAIDGDYGELTARAVKALYTRARQPLPTAANDSAANDSAANGSAANDSAPGGSDEPDSDSGTKAEGGAEGSPDKATGIDTPLPMAEVVDVPGGGATVLSVAGRGTIVPADGKLLSLRAGSASVTVRVRVADKAAFASGVKVTLSFPGSSAERTAGTVRSLSEFRPAGDEGSAPGFDAVIDPGPLPEDIENGTKAVATPGAAQEAIRALAVPLTALREDAAGTYVIKAAGRARIAVTTGREGNGYVQVTECPELKAGTVVVLWGEGG